MKKNWICGHDGFDPLIRVTRWLPKRRDLRAQLLITSDQRVESSVSRVQRGRDRLQSEQDPILERGSRGLIEVVRLSTIDDGRKGGEGNRSVVRHEENEKRYLRENKKKN